MYVKTINHNIYKNLAIFCLAFALSFSALADNKLKSVVDVVEMDYQTTLLQAKNGNPDAQTNIGLRYIYGYEVVRDYNKAYEWLIQAADQGYARAQYHIGMMYSEGQSVAEEKAIAAKWLKQSAEQGFDYAQLHLGLQYMQGLGVTQNYNEAIRWLTLAADQQVEDAQYYMGVIYFSDEVVAKDESLAKKYFGQACKNHHAKSCQIFIKLGE